MSWCRAIVWKCWCIWLLKPASERQTFPHISQLTWWLYAPGAGPCSPLRTDLLKAAYWTWLFLKYTMPTWISFHHWLPSLASFSHLSIDMLNCLRQHFIESLSLFFGFDAFLFPSHICCFSRWLSFIRTTWPAQRRELFTTMDSMLGSQALSNTSVSRISDWHPIQSICRWRRWRVLIWCLYRVHVSLAWKKDATTDALSTMTFVLTLMPCWYQTCLLRRENDPETFSWRS